MSANPFWEFRALQLDAPVRDSLTVVLPFGLFADGNGNRVDAGAAASGMETIAMHGYLVLSRDVNESIVFTLEDGRKIHILIADIRANSVRIACSAPKTVRIFRDEVQKRIDSIGDSTEECDRHKNSTERIRGGGTD